MKRALFLLAAIIMFAPPASSQKKTTGTSQSRYINISKPAAGQPSPAGKTASGRVASGTSQAKRVSIKKPVTRIPLLEILQEETRFSDYNGDNIIDGNETFTIHLSLLNKGEGPGIGLRALVKETNNLAGISFNPEIVLGRLDSGLTRKIEIPVFATADVPTSLARFIITISEANGFGTDPMEIEIRTHAFRQPDVRVVDITCRDSANIAKKVSFPVNVMIQNLGQGIAREVEASLVLPKDVLVLSEKQTIGSPELNPGKTLEGKFELVVREGYLQESVPVQVKVKEKYGLYSRDTIVWLALRKTEAKKLIVQGQETTPVDIKKGSLASAVDRGFPVAGKSYPNRFALVIGNENYRRASSSEGNVPYALNDAGIFYQYARTTLGIPEVNCILLKDATSGEMITNIGVIIERVKLRPQQAELFIFYAGHGLPDTDPMSRAPYLIPVDGDAANLKTTIALSTVYNQLAETGAKRITVFLDACFSGGGRGDNGLLADSRMAKVAPKKETLGGRMVVFSATTGAQVANPYHKEQHGMFTYFLLKKIQESNGKCTYGELFDEVKYNVSENALIINRQSQQPDIQFSGDAENIWRDWDFN